MPDQITVASSDTGVGSSASAAHQAATHGPDHPGHDHAVTSIREQFNPLGVGLRSIWPQSDCGY